VYFRLITLSSFMEDMDSPIFSGSLERPKYNILYHDALFMMESRFFLWYFP
jgi:hypothetical protein